MSFVERKQRAKNFEEHIHKSLCLFPKWLFPSTSLQPMSGEHLWTGEGILGNDMQMSPPVNRISLSNNGIGPTCRFLNWSQACPGQMCKQDHFFLVLETRAAEPHGGGEEDKNHMTGYLIRNHAGVQRFSWLSTSHVFRYSYTFANWGELSVMSPSTSPGLDSLAVWQGSPTVATGELHLP